MIDTYLKLIAEYPALASAPKERALLYAYRLGHNDGEIEQIQTQIAKQEIAELREAQGDDIGHA